MSCASTPYKQLHLPRLSFKKSHIFSAPKCAVDLDICFIVDSSGSIRDSNVGDIDNWGLQLDFLRYVTAAYNVGKFISFFIFWLLVVFNCSAVNLTIGTKNILKC